MQEDQEHNGQKRNGKISFCAHEAISVIRVHGRFLFLVASFTSRDLLLCAKHLFVAAIVSRIGKSRVSGWC
jgi:hypothetical protein